LRCRRIKITEYQYVEFGFSILDAEQRQRLLAISRSRTEPTSRVERARIILAYLQDPSAYAVARAIGVTQQTVTRCLESAAELGGDRGAR
jgi:hypothetical protein